MSWSAFQCPNPDFYIRSVQDDLKFGVLKSRLVAASNVFRDMFSCCDTAPNSPHTDTLDLDETATLLSILLRLIHEPPQEYAPQDFVPLDKFETQIPVVDPTSAIPLPLLPTLYRLADKFMLVQPIVHTLHTHLAAHKSIAPLRVYGIAAGLGLEAVAAEASYYLLHPPLHTYSLEDIRVIPTAEAYHKLLLLQAHRVAKLREILTNEDIFPYGYGACPQHEANTTSLWDERRKSVCSKIESGTDVAEEMRMVKDVLNCANCEKAAVAAIEMLAYKCRRVARRIDKLPA